MEQVDLELLQNASATNQNLISEIDSFGALPQETHPFIASVRECHARFQNQILVFEKFPNRLDFKMMFNDLKAFNTKLREFLSILNDNLIFPPQFCRPLAFYLSIKIIDNIDRIRAPTRYFFNEELYK